MQESVRKEQVKAQFFVVDDQILVPSRFSNPLMVTLRYRKSSTASGSI